MPKTVLTVQINDEGMLVCFIGKDFAEACVEVFPSKKFVKTLKKELSSFAKNQFFDVIDNGFKKNVEAGLAP